MASKREFIAVGIPESVRNYIASLFDHSVPRIRWVPKENLHLTMRFLGDISEEKEDQLCQQLRAVTVSSFTLETGRIGVFPTKGPPRVVWVGLGTGHPLLFQLRQQIDDAILRAGIDCEMRDFIPHITIGRCHTATTEAIKALASKYRNESGPVFYVRNFSLFESRPSPHGSRYLELESFPLKRGRADSAIPLHPAKGNTLYEKTDLGPVPEMHQKNKHWKSRRKAAPTSGDKISYTLSKQK